MADSRKNLMQRKAELVIQSSLLREKLAVEALSLMQVPDVVSQGLGILGELNRIRKNPLFIGSILVAVFAIRPRRLVSWAVSATVLFKTWRRFGPIVMPLIGFLARRKK